MAFSNSRKPSINVTPLIDVLLVLLIIFMVVAPTHPAQFEAQIPGKPDTLGPVPEAGPLVVTLDRNRIVTLGGSPVTLADLERTLAVELSSRMDHTVIFKAPRGTPYATVVDVIDRLKGAGATQLGLQVDLLEM